jgi:hypothetical protein
MRTKSKWSPGPGVKVLGVALTDDETWVVSAAAPAMAFARIAAGEAEIGIARSTSAFRIIYRVRGDATPGDVLQRNSPQ